MKFLAFTGVLLSLTVPLASQSAEISSSRPLLVPIFSQDEADREGETDEFARHPEGYFRLQMRSFVGIDGLFFDLSFRVRSFEVEPIRSEVETHLARLPRQGSLVSLPEELLGWYDQELLPILKEAYRLRKQGKAFEAQQLRDDVAKRWLSALARP